MARCPSCGADVPTRSFLDATGLSGIFCPACGISLGPKYWSSALLLAISLLLATLLHMLAHHSGVGFPLDLVIWVLAFVFFYVLFQPVLVRLRAKQS